MADLFEHVPEMTEWKDESEAARFFGRRVSELDRDELLAMIGFMARSARAQRQRFEDERKFWHGLINPQKKQRITND